MPPPVVIPMIHEPIAVVDGPSGRVEVYPAPIEIVTISYEVKNPFYKAPAIALPTPAK